MSSTAPTSKRSKGAPTPSRSREPSRTDFKGDQHSAWSVFYTEALGLYPKALADWGKQKRRDPLWVTGVSGLGFRNCRTRYQPTVCSAFRASPSHEPEPPAHKNRACVPQIKCTIVGQMGGGGGAEKTLWLEGGSNYKQIHRSLGHLSTLNIVLIPRSSTSSTKPATPSHPSTDPAGWLMTSCKLQDMTLKNGQRVWGLQRTSCPRMCVWVLYE